MVGLTLHQRAVALTVILFTGFCVLIAIAGDYTAEYKYREGMMFGFNATSDDMLNYTDSADATISNNIKWKIRGCSTISQSDLDIAVANARRAQQIEDSILCNK